MRPIFISYRRRDAEGEAGRLFADLVRRFGKGNVFMDVEALKKGLNFKKQLDERVAECGVLLAVIGRDWLNVKDEAGNRRLDDPDDFVRLETVAALKRDIPVIPLLVQGAQMPGKDKLPESMRELHYRNGMELNHTRWDSDVGLLITALEEMDAPEADALATDQPKSTAKVAGIAAGFVALLVLVYFAGGWITRALQGGSRSDDGGSVGHKAQGAGLMVPPAGAPDAGSAGLNPGSTILKVGKAAFSGEIDLDTGETTEATAKADLPGGDLVVQYDSQRNMSLSPFNRAQMSAPVKMGGGGQDRCTGEPMSANPRLITKADLGSSYCVLTSEGRHSYLTINDLRVDQANGGLIQVLVSYTTFSK